MKAGRSDFIGLACCLAWSILFLSAPAALASKDDSESDEKVDLVMLGDARCTSCHDDLDAPDVLRIGKTRHGVTADDRTPTCVGCHGTSKRHETEAGRGSGPTTPPDIGYSKEHSSTPEERSRACLSCHEQGAAHALWAGSAHETRNVACTNCHRIHVDADPILSKSGQAEICYACHKTVRAQHQRISTHPVGAGEMTCADCHAAHGSTGPKLMLRNSISETCFACHAEKRGPFLWEHAPAVDNCMNCHTAHGSTATPLLKARSPWLCQNCHNQALHPGDAYSGSSLPGGAVANVSEGTPVNPLTGVGVGRNNPPTQLAYRACANCHSQIHGSNHPAGQHFLR